MVAGTTPAADLLLIYQAHFLISVHDKMLLFLGDVPDLAADVVRFRLKICDQVYLGMLMFWVDLCEPLQDEPDYFDPPGGLLSFDLRVSHLLKPASHLKQTGELQDLHSHFDLVNGQLAQVAFGTKTAHLL